MKNIPLTIKRLSLLTCLIASSGLAQAAIEHYEIDTAHSSITFKARHFFSQVLGSLPEFSGTIHFDAEQPENSSVEAVIQAASIDTNHEKRDAHLRNEDFLHVDKYPKMTFRSTAWEPKGDNHFSITGDLTILETTLPVTLDTRLLGMGEGFDKETFLSGWSATAKLVRSDFGITYGKPAVGDEIEIEISIEAQRVSPDSE